MLINHNCIENLNWNNSQNFEKGQILILGSFNPYNPIENPEFYYGRSSNYFWKEIGLIVFNNENHFINSQNKLNFINEHKIVFYDLINSIEITEVNNDENTLNDFVSSNIFTNFTDNKIFTSSSKYRSNNKNINIRRNYNNNIINFIEASNSVRKIIHTLGNSRIDLNFNTKPREYSLNANGLQGLINSIIEVTNRKNILFNNISYSPSQIAVNRGGIQYRNQLRSWLKENLDL